MKTKKKKNILILDVNNSYNEKLADLLENNFNANVYHPENKDDLPVAVEKMNPEVIIYDLFSSYRIFGMTLESVNSLSTDSQVVVLSFETNEELIEMCINNGATGFIDKRIKEMNLISESLKRILKGEISVLTSQHFA